MHKSKELKETFYLYNSTVIAQILHLLKETPQGFFVCDISIRMNKKQCAISTALKLMHKYNIVKYTKHGIFRIYSKTGITPLNVFKQTVSKLTK